MSKFVLRHQTGAWLAAILSRKMPNLAGNMASDNSKKRKKRRREHTRSNVGMAPGTIFFRGEQKTDRVTIREISFDKEELSDQMLTAPEQVTPGKGPGVQWLDVVGLHEEAVIDQIGLKFGIHRLTLEDVLNTQQRPKLETFDSYLFWTVRMIRMNPETDKLINEQVSILFGDGWLISFQEQEGDVFEFVRERLRANKGRIRGAGADYLAYALLDAIVDNYFVAVEEFSDRVEDLEENLLKRHVDTDLVQLQRMKREVIGLRKNIWPLREVVNLSAKSETQLVHPDTEIYLRDLYDHIIQVADTVESLRDIIGGVQDLYLSIVNNKMNEVMKVLAIISTIFLPMSLVAGIYGMNFKIIPETNWSLGYPFSLAIMVAIGMGMFFFFKKRNWL